VTTPETDWRALYPFESRWHDHGGVRQHYVDEGAGPPLVLVHGNPTWSFFFRHLIEGLRDEWRVIAPDHVGCGLSDKPQDYAYTLGTHVDNLERLLEALGVREATLILHDWGGAVGMGWAARHPARVKRFVVMNTAAWASRRVPLRIRACRIPLLGALAVRGLNLFVRAASIETVHHRERMTPAVRAGYLAPYDSWAHRIAVHRFVQDIPFRPDAPSLPVLGEMERTLPQFRDLPMLIQWGARDWCFDRHFLDAWRERFPCAQVDVYEDAAHYLLEDAHERIVPRVRRFLAETRDQVAEPCIQAAEGGTG
jgi:haloalkane dehalogenase